MRKISSSYASVLKVILPAVLIALLILGTLVGTVVLVVLGQPIFIVLVLMGAAGVTVFGYFVLRATVSDLIDEIYLDGDKLIVRNGRQEERIPLANLAEVSATRLRNPERVTLKLREPSRLGQTIVFVPTKRMHLGSPHPIAAELMELAAAARAGKH